MPQRLHHLFPLAIMLLLAAITFWLKRLTDFDPQQSDGKFRHDPDYMVEQLTGKRFDAQGDLQYSLEAQRMVHYPDDDSTWVEAPRVLFLGGREPVRISSRTATISRDGQRVDMQDDVRLVREPSQNRGPMTLDTSALTVFPEDEQATTAAPVRITQGSSVVNGVGLDYNNLTAVGVLRSRVRGVLQPADRR